MAICQACRQLLMAGHGIIIYLFICLDWEFLKGTHRSVSHNKVDVKRCFQRINEKAHIS